MHGHDQGHGRFLRSKSVLHAVFAKTAAALVQATRLEISEEVRPRLAASHCSFLTSENNYALKASAFRFLRQPSTPNAPTPVGRERVAWSCRECWGIVET